MKLLKKISAFALIIVSIFSISFSAQAAYSTMYVTCPEGETVRLRQSPSTSAAVLDNISRGTAVQAEYYNATWHKVTYGNLDGYMMSSFLSTTPPSVSTEYNDMFVYCSPGETVRLRTAPSTSASVITNIPHETLVQGRYYNSAWYQVRYGNYNGYMQSHFLLPVIPSSEGWEERYTTTNFTLSNTYRAGVANFQDDLNYYFNEVDPLSAPDGWVDLEVDGYFGQKSVNATKAFQQIFSDLDVDGIAGPATKARLFESTRPNH